MSRSPLFCLLLLFFIQSVNACKCKEQTAKESFCNAHWVSHLRIKLRVSKQAVPGNNERKGLNNIRYAVEHIQVFKHKEINSVSDSREEEEPSGDIDFPSNLPSQTPSNLTTLPDEIYTPSEPVACGLILDVGKEYLLAGRVAPGGTLSTVICGQLRPDDSKESLFENVLEWKSVPPSFPPKIKSFTC